MSVFQVQLNNVNQGTLDDTNPSVQRTAYIEGPNRIKREIIDGTQFTDVNYYKRYCYPQVSLEDAILSVVTDDGSVWSDVASENVYPMSYTSNVNAHTTYSQTADNLIDVMGTTGGYAVFAQMTNSSGAAVTVRLNGTATFVLGTSTTQTFNVGDVSITKIEFLNATGSNTVVSTLLSIQLVANS